MPTGTIEYHHRHLRGRIPRLNLTGIHGQLATYYRHLQTDDGLVPTSSPDGHPLSRHHPPLPPAATCDPSTATCSRLTLAPRVGFAPAVAACASAVAALASSVAALAPLVATSVYYVAASASAVAACARNLRARVRRCRCLCCVCHVCLHRVP